MFFDVPELQASIRRSSRVADESDVARLLDRALDHSLMGGAVPGTLAGEDPPLAGAELLERQDVLVIDPQHFLPAEPAPAAVGDLRIAAAFTAQLIVETLPEGRLVTA
jgi:hypothetical protein